MVNADLSITNVMLLSEGVFDFQPVSVADTDQIRHQIHFI